jgi:large subunit ribosomal protein L30
MGRKMAQIEKATARSLRVTQLKSSIGYPADQLRTLKALGLGKINRSVDQVDNPAVRGMIFKVKHLVKVEEI